MRVFQRKNEIIVAPVNMSGDLIMEYRLVVGLVYRKFGDYIHCNALLFNPDDCRKITKYKFCNWNVRDKIGRMVLSAYTGKLCLIHTLPREFEKSRVAKVITLNPPPHLSRYDLGEFSSCLEDGLEPVPKDFEFEWKLN